MLNDRSWYATASGPAYKDSNGSMHYFTGPYSPKTKTLALNGSSLWVGADDGGISSIPDVNAATPALNYVTTNDAAVEALYFVNGVPFAATSKSLQYLLNGQFYDVKIGPASSLKSLSCTNALTAAYSSTQSNMYAVGKY